MLWIVVAGVVLGLVFFVGAWTQKQTSTRGLGKGEGHTGRSHYKNRGSTRREKRDGSP